MTAAHIVDPARLLGEALAEASPDLMRSLLQTMINALLSADADAVVGAEYGRPSPGRTTQRNGYRHRDLDTRVGTIDVAIPKLRKGSYFPEWLLERRKRAETALITVVADCYLAGVSTRRMDKLVKTLGIDSLSKSQVSRMAADLDEHVEQFRHRPLDTAGPFTFVAADALTMKVREGGRVTSASARGDSRRARCRRSTYDRMSARSSGRCSPSPTLQVLRRWRGGSTPSATAVTSRPRRGRTRPRWAPSGLIELSGERAGRIRSMRGDPLPPSAGGSSRPATATRASGCWR